jgi:hypothetical protein
MTLNRAIPHLAAIAVAVSAAFAAAPATAAEPANPKFQALDKNNDGFITRDEVVGTRWYDKAFDQADENRDGRLDQTEFVKAEAIQDRDSAGHYASDTYIKGKVKTKLLATRGLKSRDLDIEVLGGEVMLSGFIRDEQQRSKAIQVASSVKGVTSVNDKMVVR